MKSWAGITPLYLALAALLAGSTAGAMVACSGGSAHEVSTDSGSDAPSTDGGRPDGSKMDAAGDHATTAPDAISDAIADGGADSNACALGPQGEYIELICTNLYSDWATKTVSAGVKPYVPGLQLWSDGAEKNRWIYLPPSTQIDTSNMDEWTFPVGTQFYKEFRLPVGASTTPTRIETRLLWKQTETVWYRTTYRWSADGETSATELTSGENDANGGGYEVPDQTMCNTCHVGRLDGILGFEAVGLSAPGGSLITMSTLVSDGLVTNPPSGSLAVPGDAIQSAALGWLHVNCGTACHNRNMGSNAFAAGFFMRLDVATLGSVEATDTYTTGWNALTTSGYAIPDAPATYRIHACDLAESAAYYRISLRDGVDGTPFGTQMPQIDTHKVDDAGVAEIAAWITEGCDGGTDAH